MRDKVRFIHAADLHLGSLLHTRGNPPQEINYIFQRATMEAFRRICDAAINYRVDFLLLAGDVYDREARSVVANQFFNQQCHRLEENGIGVYLIAGNHDPLRQKGGLLDTPKNVVVFESEEVGLREIRKSEGEMIARVLGQSYRGSSESRKMYSQYIVPDVAVPNIGLLHSQLDPQNRNYVPCTLADLVSKDDIHYWALGHIHTCRILRKENPAVAYPGIPQGRDFGEEGTGGCLLVEFNSNSKPELKFIPVTLINWKSIEINIDRNSGNIPGNLNELEGLILKEAESLLYNKPSFPEDIDTVEDIENFLAGYVVRWIITGRGKIHELIMEQEEETREVLEDTLRKKLTDKSPFIWTDSVVFRTGKPVPDISKLKENNSIFQEIEEVSMLSLEDNQMKEELLNSLGKVWDFEADSENYDEKKLPLNKDEVKMIIEQAKQIIVEELMEGREWDEN